MDWYSAVPVRYGTRLSKGGQPVRSTPLSRRRLQMLRRLSSRTKHATIVHHVIRMILLLCGGVGCASWVWMASKHQCFLKSARSKKTESTSCVDCVSDDIDGDYFLYFYDDEGRKWPPTTADVKPKDRSWASETWPWMPPDVARQMCRVTYGYDQPAEFDMLKKPLILPYHFMCCDECAKIDRKFRGIIARSVETLLLG